MFHIPSLKAAMKDAGYPVSDSVFTMSVDDLRHFYDYAYHKFGLSKEKAGYGLAYPTTVSATMPGHPDNPETPKVELTATPDETQALIPPVTYPTPTPQPSPININDLANPAVTEVTETPADETEQTEQAETAAE